MSERGDREILNIEEAAALLGVSIKTFNKVLHSQNMPARKIGREWKFSRRALIEWVGSGSSHDFYKESPDNGKTSATREASGRGPSQPRQRRTAGWNLEY